MQVETPVRAIRTKCLECANWSHKEVAECNLTDCALWPYRKGKRPTPEDVEIVKATIDPFAEQKEAYRQKYGRNVEKMVKARELSADEADSDCADDSFLT